MTGLLFAGTLIGNPGAPPASGGTLTITGNGATNIFSVQDASSLGSGAAAGTFNFPLGDLIFGVDSINGSGFSSLVLDQSAGGVGFSPALSR